MATPELLSVDVEFVVPGFRFAGLHCGIKKGDAPDLALLVADGSCAVAGVFTQNLVVAGPVVLSRGRVAAGRARAVVINSGNANACTVSSLPDAERMTAMVATAIGCEPGEVLVCSTGVIGAPLPMAPLARGIPQAVSTLDNGALPAFARAIMTTDTRPKMRSATGRIGGRIITAAGASKGAGMIHPNMATMLAFVATDAPVRPEALDPLWRRICQRAFNAISIDGDTSTNDTALIFASGAAGGPDLDGPDLAALEALLDQVAQALAKDIVRDAEGGTKTVAIQVTGAASFEVAQRVANTIATSPLVKTALHGEDPNWGRIIAAAGRAGVELDPNALTLWMEDARLFADGAWLGPVAEVEANAVMKRAEYGIRLDLGQGAFEHTVITCDFSAGYVQINADYRS